MVDRRRKKDENLLQFINSVIEYLAHLNDESRGNGGEFRTRHREYSLSYNHLPHIVPNIVFEEIDKYLPISNLAPNDLMNVVDLKFPYVYSINEIKQSIEYLKKRCNDEFDEIPEILLKAF